MSAQSFSDAFLPIEAENREIMQFDTFGHLYPEPRKIYTGRILFTIGAYGDIVPINSSFNIDSPWFFRDMINLIEHKAKKQGVVYRFTGTYMKFKNGNHRFSGKTVIAARI